MDKEQRGPLLVDQEETKEKINTIKHKLSETGEILRRLSTALLSEPENIKFPNAPEPLSLFPVDRDTPHSFAWDTLPDFKQIAQLIQSLRHEQKRLSDIQQNLLPETS